jgi:hypothetical protein
MHCFESSLENDLTFQLRHGAVDSLGKLREMARGYAGAEMMLDV